MTVIPIIACASGKGGSGKTTVAVNLAACLAERGIRPLLVDLDAQGDASDLLGVYQEENPLPIEQTSVQLFSGLAGSPLMVHGVGILAFHTKINAEANTLYDRRVQRNFRDGLQKTIAAWNPDVVFIDLPPLQNVAAAGAIVYCSSVITSLKPCYSHVKGSVRVLDMVKAENSDGNDMKLLAVIPMGEATTINAREALELARAQFGDAMTIEIPNRTVVEEASWEHIPVRVHEKRQLEREPKQRDEKKYRTVGSKFMEVTEEIARRLGLVLQPLPMPESQKISSEGSQS